MLGCDAIGKRRVRGLTALAAGWALVACSQQPASEPSVGTGVDNAPDVQVGVDTTDTPPAVDAWNVEDATNTSATLPTTCSASTQCGPGKVCKLWPGPGLCVDCLSALDCAKGDLCLHNQCAPPKACASDKQCAAMDAVCSGEVGVCVECQTADECPAKHTCVAQQCQPPPAACKSSKECGAYEQLCDKSAGVCVACAEHADCPEPGFCSGGICVPDVCQPGQKACATPTALAVCSSDGAGATDIVCAPGHACEDDDCRPVVCTPGQALCTADGKPATCSKRGTSTVVGSPCPPQTQCLGGVCSSAKCIAGSKQCVGTAIGTCAADGQQWLEAACPTGSACDPASQPAACKPQVCKAGAAICDGKLAKACTSSGLGYVTSDDCSKFGPDGKPRACVGGACLKQNCVPGALTCLGVAKLATCKAIGVGYDEKPCAASEACEAKACKPKVCSPEESLCIGNTIHQCSPAGTALAKQAECPANQFCVAAAGKAQCSNQLCMPGTLACSAGNDGVKTCNAGGSAWVVAACAPGFACEQAACKQVVCQPGTLGCTGAVAVKCNASGTASTLVADCALAGKVCVAGQCVVAGCGDGKVNTAGEACDDGNSTDGDGCSSVCQTEAKCATACAQGEVCQPEGGCAKACANGPCGYSAQDVMLTGASTGLTKVADGVKVGGLGQPKVNKYLWVANSPNNTVSRVDVDTCKEVGRYTVCKDPSRTAVDFDGNAWVGCRGDGGVAKIIANKAMCVDKNGNGQIETSEGEGASAALPAGTDECIAFTVFPDGATIARALAVDGDNNVWVGFWNSKHLHLLKSKTGNSLDSIDIGCNPYGMAIDGNGDVWVQGAGCGQLVRLTPSTKNIQKYQYKVGAYGICVDPKGRIWTASGGSAAAFDAANAGPNAWTVTTGIASGGRGVACAADGKVYIAGDSASSITVIDGNQSPPTVLYKHKGASYPVGVAVDKNGQVWAVNQSSSTATRHDPVSGAVTCTVPVGSSPYTYSDMTGNSLQFLGSKAGVWRGTFFVPHALGPLATVMNVNWTELVVKIQVPPAATAVVRVRTAASAQALGQAVWSAPLQFKTPETVDLSPVAPLAGAFLEVDLALELAPDGASPLVSKVAASFAADPVK